MRVGIGLPNTHAGVRGERLLEWARRADRGPFASLGVLDRPPYEGFEPFVALAGAAAVTARVRLVTMVAIGPLRPSPLLAKSAASVDQLSGGRLVLGLSIGARPEDYPALGLRTRGRGRKLSEQLADLREFWEDGSFGPRPVQPGGPPLLVGGLSGESFRRMARHAAGYVHGGGPPRAFATAASRARAAWTDLGRPGLPQLWGQGYFALGDEDTLERGSRYLLDYYAFTGPFAEKIAAGALTSPQAITDFVRGYEDAGCDELVLLPAVPELEQVDRLAGVLAVV